MSAWLHCDCGLQGHLLASTAHSVPRMALAVLVWLLQHRACHSLGHRQSAVQRLVSLLLCCQACKVSQAGGWPCRTPVWLSGHRQARRLHLQRPPSVAAAAGLCVASHLPDQAPHVHKRSTHRAFDVCAAPHAHEQLSRLMALMAVYSTPCCPLRVPYSPRLTCGLTCLARSCLALLKVLDVTRPALHGRPAVQALKW